MKLSDLRVDPKTLDTYAPPRHRGTVNHRLWPKPGMSGPIEVIRGHLAFGGGADPHYHANSDQMVYMLSGQLRIVGLEDEVILSNGEFMMLPKGLEHRVEVLTQPGADILVMYMPQLSFDDILPAKTLKWKETAAADNDN